MRSKKEIEQMIVFFSAARHNFLIRINPVFRFFYKRRLKNYELAINLLHFCLGSLNPEFFDFDKCEVKND